MRNYIPPMAVLWTVYAPQALAGTGQSTPGDTAMLVALGLSLAALAYCGNRWRRWWLGFQVGDATASEFLGALKWSAIAAVVTVASLWAAVQFK